MKLRTLSRLATALLVGIGLTGCELTVLNPAGDVAAQSGNLVIVSTLLMLIIILPVMFLIVYFAWKYREKNNPSDYDPEWHHSTKLELVIWSVTLLIIIALGALTWIYTHKLDPYRPLDRIAAGRPVPAEVKPLEVEVIAMDWKWLFIYPEQGIATVNEMAAPVDRPIRMKITATTTMNAFYVPDLAGMIYAMPAMETQLNAVINKPGVFQGMSSHYSGSGFSGMTFKFHGLNDQDFDAWVAKAKSAGTALDRPTYLALEKPSERNPVQRYASVDATLYHAILNRCVAEGKACMDAIMAKDAMANTRARAEAAEKKAGKAEHAEEAGTAAEHAAEHAAGHASAAH